MPPVGCGGSARRSPLSFAAAAPPSITSLNYDQGDTAGGGQSIIITGTSLAGATGVSFGGTPAIITANTSTTVTCTLPAHAAGAVNVSVTTPSGTSNALSFEFWSPLSLPSLTGWWRIPYAGSPLTGVTGGALSEPTNPPAIGNGGRALGGFNTADFDGANDVLRTANDWNTYITGTGGSVFVLFNADSAAASSGTYYDDPALVSDDNFGFNFGFSAGGLGVAFYDGAWKTPLSRVACSTGAWHCAKLRWNGASVEFGADAGAFSSFVAGTLQTNVGSKLALGAVGISSPGFLDGRIADLVTMSASVSDANVTKTRKYCAQRYGVSV